MGAAGGGALRTERAARIRRTKEWSVRRAVESTERTCTPSTPQKENEQRKGRGYNLSEKNSHSEFFFFFTCHSRITLPLGCSAGNHQHHNHHHHHRRRSVWRGMRRAVAISRESHNTADRYLLCTRLRSGRDARPHLKRGGRAGPR